MFDLSLSLSLSLSLAVTDSCWILNLILQERDFSDKVNAALVKLWCTCWQDFHLSSGVFSQKPLKADPEILTSDLFCSCLIWLKAQKLNQSKAWIWGWDPPTPCPNKVDQHCQSNTSREWGQAEPRHRMSELSLHTVETFCPPPPRRHGWKSKVWRNVTFGSASDIPVLAFTLFWHWRQTQ